MRRGKLAERSDPGLPLSEGAPTRSGSQAEQSRSPQGQWTTKQAVALMEQDQPRPPSADTAHSGAERRCASQGPGCPLPETRAVYPCTSQAVRWDGPVCEAPSVPGLLQQHRDQPANQQDAVIPEDTGTPVKKSSPDPAASEHSAPKSDPIQG